MRLSRTAAMVRFVQSPEILDIVPEHVADPVVRAPWRRRVLTGCGDGLLSVLLNGAVVVGLIGVGWPVRRVEAPEAISVDLIDHMPEGKPSGPVEGTTREGGQGTANPKAAAAETDRPSAAPAPSHAPAPPEPATATDAKPESPAVADGAPKADTTAETASKTETAAPETPAVTSGPGNPPPVTGQPDVASSSPQPATPPPPEHPDASTAPRLVEAPSAPPPAPKPPEPKPESVTSAPPPPEPKSAAAEPTLAPPVLSTTESPDAVPAPTPPPEVPKPLTAEQKRQAENTAKLAAMLPFGANIHADPSQSPAATQGQGASTAYRGAVYANFSKAQDVIEDARAKHLKGQAVIAFSINDQGGIATIAVAVSSGNPAVDQAALEMIRRAAPFPPPPPGAQRTFSPAIGLGLE